jgi:multiple sugar transport system ATP-binding protein
MRASLAQLHERLGVTTIYVTHDQVEAMTLGQRVAVLRSGVIQQVDTPQALYARPDNLFVAAFIGSPAMNLVEATVSDGVASFAGWNIPLDAARRPRREGRVILGIRPEAFEDAALSDSSLPTVDIDVLVLEELGSDTHAIFPIDAPRVEAEDLRAAADNEDETLIADDRALWNARLAARTQARPGAPLRLAVDPAQLYFFDPDTGASLTSGAAVAAAVA